MKKTKDKWYCVSCVYFVQHADHDFNGFCAFSWPPYMTAKAQPVSAYDTCSLYKELKESDMNIDDIDIEFVEE